MLNELVGWCLTALSVQISYRAISRYISVTILYLQKLLTSFHQIWHVAYSDECLTAWFKLPTSPDLCTHATLLSADSYVKLY